MFQFDKGEFHKGILVFFTYLRAIQLCGYTFYKTKNLAG